VTDSGRTLEQTCQILRRCVNASSATFGLRPAPASGATCADSGSVLPVTGTTTGSIARRTISARGPQPHEQLSAVADGSMPLAVFADYAEDVLGWPSSWADCFRKTIHYYQAMSVLRELFRGKPLPGFTLQMWQWLYPTPYSRTGS
jgi:hypothetical protein